MIVVTCKRCKTPLIFSRCHNANCKNYQPAWSQGAYNALRRGTNRRQRRLSRAS